MKKTLLLTVTLGTVFTIGANSHHDSHLLHVPAKVSFEGSFFGKLDGVYGVVDGETIGDCLETARIISQIIFGVTDPVTKKKVGVVTYKGGHYTLKEVLHQEDELIKRGVKTHEAEYLHLLEILKAIKVFFQKAAGPLLEKTKKPVVKTMNLKLIAAWIEQSGRNTSIMRLFGDDSVEMKALEESNIREFYTFLNDLKCFLKDLMRSAPKACMQHKKESLRPEDYAKFDAFIRS